MGYNERGIYLKTILLFRVFSKPIFIPWEDLIEIEKKKRFLFTEFVIKIGSPEIGKMSIRQSTFEEIQRAYEKYHHDGKFQQFS